MLISFFHDHKFRFDGKIYYSTGAVNERVLEKYIGKGDTLNVYARIVPAEENGTLSPITDERIHIFHRRNVSLKDAVKNSDACIIRLPSFTGIYAAYLARKYRKKYLIEVVSSAFDALTHHSLAGRIIAPYIEFAVKREVKKAKYVTYVTADFLQKEYPNSARNIGVSDVVLPESSDDALAFRLSKIAQNNGKLILGTIGSYEVRYKSQETVIRALGILKKMGKTGFELHLVGADKSRYLAKIAEAEGVLEQVKFLGTIQHEDINSFYDTIDVYIQPSLLEGLCRSIVEAFNRALPCIASDVGGNPELLGKECLFSHKANPEKQLAEILLKLDKGKMKVLAEENFEKAKLYQMEYLFKRWKDFYDEFIDAR